MTKRKLDGFGFDQVNKKTEPTVLEKTIIDSDSCKVIYIENFFTKEQEKQLLDELTQIEFNKEIIKMFGKEIVAPRETFSYGDKGMSYTYARKRETCVEWSLKMQEVRDMVFKKCQEYGDTEDNFNFVLLNKYKTGNDYIGLHCDNEKDMISESIIASVSIGAERRFNLIKNSNKERTSIMLKSGSLLLMLGKTQDSYKHTLPKTKIQCSERYNLTFRHLKNKI